MDLILGGIAFAVLVAGQLAAVIAVHTATKIEFSFTGTAWATSHLRAETRATSFA